jgi:DNA-binding beta-propeller fold protein YncE
MPINAIRKFSRKGEDLGNFVSAALNGPAGVVFDKEGNLYVSNRSGNTIRKFSRSGEDLGDFATTGMSGPVGLAFSPADGDDSDSEDDSDAEEPTTEQ